MNYELLRGKHLLLDTNILINYTIHPREMEEVRLRLEEHEAIPILDELVRFEYIRGAASPQEIESLKKFLITLFGLTPETVDTPQFPVTQEIINFATDIANVYACKLKKLNVPAIDCFLAAQMRKYRSRLLLVTSDHKDFPPLLFDRIGIETIDTGADIINICFYKFNTAKYDRAWAEFQKAR